MEDFSPKVPAAKGRASVLDPYKEIIEGHLDEDEKNWHKQRYTVKRIHDRLAEERDARVGYTTVQLYVKKRRAERKAPRDMFLKLVWASGEAQVDFGEADFYVYGEKQRLHHLTVDFPYSNVGFSRVLHGESSECVCQGLINVFRYIGGVPVRLVFDNGFAVLF